MRQLQCIRPRRLLPLLVTAFSAAGVLAGAALVLAPASSAASSAYTVSEVPVAAGLVDSVAADPATDTIYADDGDGIAAIDGATNTVTAVISLPTAPGALAVDEASDTVYAISHLYPDAYVISGATNTLTATISLPSALAPFAAAVNPVTNMVYVTDYVQGTVAVIDGSTDTLAATIQLADPTLDPKPFPRGVAVDTATNMIYVGDEGGDQVEAIDGTTNAVASRIALPADSSPADVAVDPAAGLVYVAEQAAGAISVIDTATGDVSTLASGLSEPLALALDPGSGTLFAASTEGGTVGLGTTYAVDAATGAITDQIPRGAESVAATPASGGSAYLANGQAATPLSGYVTTLTPSTATTMSPVILATCCVFSFTVGQSGQLQLTASATPAATFSATGLPDGLTISPSGLVSGTPLPGAGGDDPVMVTATNGVAPPFTETLYIPVYQACVITSADQVTFNQGVAGTFTFTATGYPAPTFSETGALPSGVSLTASGVLSGTPAAGTAGVYPIQVTATNGVAATQAFTLTVDGGSSYVPVGPVRVLDTRNGTGGYDAPVGPGDTISLQVTGMDGVPASGVTAVVLNVTATDPTASSYVTVYPDGETRPTASNLNFTAGETIANLVTVPVGSDGAVDFYNNAGSTDLVADLAGYYTTASGAGSSYVPLSPSRVLDTRNGTGGYTTPVGPAETISLQVAGVGDVPATGVTAVVLNVTATDTTAGSYVTVYPDGETQPTASSLNFTPGETIPNLVVVPVGADGKVDFYNHTGSTDLVADLEGYYTTSGTGSLYVPVGPSRVLDTRNGTGGFSAPVGPGGTITLPVEGVAGVPTSGVTAVALNVTATDTTAASYVTVYPDGATQPTASNLNFTAGETIPNLVVVPVGADGEVDFYNHTGSTDLVADLEGYFTSV
jgi:DNA-binding beta-propeller fold protein YncE